jgi:hypothetical protein
MDSRVAVVEGMRKSNVHYRITRRFVMCTKPSLRSWLLSNAYMLHSCSGVAPVAESSDVPSPVLLLHTSDP